MVLLLTAAIVLPWLVMVSLLASRNTASGSANSISAADVVLLSETGQAHGSTAGEAAAATSGSGKTVVGPPPQKWTPGKKGPWGEIESMLFAIDLPDEFVFLPSPNQPPVRWHFPGYSKEQVLATLRSAGLPEDEVQKLETSAKWTTEDGVASVTPGDPLILSLSPEVRAKLYAILVAFPQNGQQIDPIWFQSGMIDWRLQDSGLAPGRLHS